MHYKVTHSKTLLRRLAGCNGCRHDGNHPIDLPQALPLHPLLHCQGSSVGIADRKKCRALVAEEEGRKARYLQAA